MCEKRRQDKIVIIGFPLFKDWCGLTKERSKTSKNHLKVVYNITKDIFSTDNLNVTIGKVLKLSNSLVSHGANTCSGMSGFPVLVGIHVGGILEESKNYFIPIIGK